MNELDDLRRQALQANLALPAEHLVKLTWGNVSGIDRKRGLVAIKASGVSYEEMTAGDIVVLDLDGNVVGGERRPSTDTPTHLVLYRAFEEIGGIVHTHSTWATAWAQAQREIPLLGTTHADLSAYPIPVTRPLTPEEVEEGYEAATGAALSEAVGPRGALEVPCVLLGRFETGGHPSRLPSRRRYCPHVPLAIPPLYRLNRDTRQLVPRRCRTSAGCPRRPSRVSR